MTDRELSRWLAKVEVAGGGCWQWTGAISSVGYGRFRIGPDNRYAHRIGYEHFVGPIPTNLVIDHLCRNRACVNPEHLEVVTERVNINRGVLPKREQTHCIHGHALADDNLYVKPNGARCCRTCSRERARRWWAKHRAA